MERKNIKETTSTQPKLLPYKAPVLVEYGDVRQLTQGGTQGALEVANNNSNFMD